MRTTQATRNTWEAHLQRLGFRRSRVSSAYTLNGTVFKTEGRWSVLQVAAPEGVDALSGQLGQPGLWKTATSGSERPLRVFDLPHTALLDDAADDDNEAPVAPFEACLAWALTTAAGEV